MKRPDMLPYNFQVSIGQFRHSMFGGLVSKPHSRHFILYRTQGHKTFDETPLHRILRGLWHGASYSHGDDTIGSANTKNIHNTHSQFHKDQCSCFGTTNSPPPIVVKFREVHVCGHPTKKFRYSHRTSTNGACDAIMQSAASIGSKGSFVGGATISRERYNRSLTILVKYDFHTPRFPESCAANFLLALHCDANLSPAWTTTIPYTSSATFLLTLVQ